jgi:hypothetical protein
MDMPSTRRKKIRVSCAGSNIPSIFLKKTVNFHGNMHLCVSPDRASAYSVFLGQASCV